MNYYSFSSVGMWEWQYLISQIYGKNLDSYQNKPSAWHTVGAQEMWHPLLNPTHPQGSPAPYLSSFPSPRLPYSPAHMIPFKECLVKARQWSECRVPQGQVIQPHAHAFWKLCGRPAFGSLSSASVTILGSGQRVPLLEVKLERGTSSAACFLPRLRSLCYLDFFKGCGQLHV